MGQLEPQAFLTALVALFESTRTKGSVYITFKRIQVKGSDAQHCLIRARTEKRKIATRLPMSDAESFNTQLGQILSSNMTALQTDAALAARGRKGTKAQAAQEKAKAKELKKKKKKRR